VTKEIKYQRANRKFTMQESKLRRSFFLNFILLFDFPVCHTSVVLKRAFWFLNLDS